MPAQDGLGLAGLAQSFQRIGPRGLQQPVTRDGVTLGQHQRLVDQRAEVIERGPLVDRCILHDVLRGLEREAASEHAEPPEHGLLIGGEQAVAPFQRRPQRLVPAQHGARAGREDVEALVQARAQALDAEQRQARRGEFDGQRDAVQPAADLDHRGGIGGGQREMRNQRLRPRHEQLHRSRVGDVRHGVGGVCRGIGGGHRQRAQAMDMFAGGLQRLLAGDQQAQVRCGGGQRLDEFGHGSGQVLAVVEQQQRALRREQRNHGLQRRTIAAELHTQRPCHRRGQQRAVGERRQFHAPHTVVVICRALVGDARGDDLRQAGLADAAGANDGDHLVAGEQRRDFLQVVHPAIELGQRRRQVAAHARRAGCRIAVGSGCSSNGRCGAGCSRCRSRYLGRRGA